MSAAAAKRLRDYLAVDAALTIVVISVAQRSVVSIRRADLASVLDEREELRAALEKASKLLDEGKEVGAGLILDAALAPKRAKRSGR